MQPGTAPIRIVLANHHPIIRSNLRLLLERDRGFRVVGEAADGREAAALAEYWRPDIVLLDVKLPPRNGISTAREISAQEQHSGILFVTVLSDQEYVSEALQAGARGYVLGDAASTDLYHAIRIVAAGGVFLSPAITAKLLEEHAAKHCNEVPVSEYNKRLCCMLAAGYTPREIAAQLDVTSDRIEAAWQEFTADSPVAMIPDVIVKSVRENHHRFEKV